MREGSGGRAGKSGVWLLIEVCVSRLTGSGGPFRAGRGGGTGAVGVCGLLLAGGGGGGGLLAGWPLPVKAFCLLRAAIRSARVENCGSSVSAMIMRVLLFALWSMVPWRGLYRDGDMGCWRRVYKGEDVSQQDNREE